MQHIINLVGLVQVAWMGHLLDLLSLCWWWLVAHSVYHSSRLQGLTSIKRPEHKRPSRALTTWETREEEEEEEEEERSY